MLPRTAIILLLLGLWSLPALSSELELTANGDFELVLDEGWELEVEGDELYFERATDLDGDPDYEVRLHCEDSHGRIELMQTCFLPSLDTVLSADLRTSATDAFGAWSAAGLMIRYLDEFGLQLGRTFVGSRSQNCPWEPAGDFDLIRGSDQWSQYNYVISDLLAGLPAVDPQRVKQLEVAVVLSAANC